MSVNKIKLNDTIIPSIPFLWYREQELFCPIYNIIKIKSQNLKNNIDGATNLQDDQDIFVVVQRNILESAHIYLCNHSYLFDAMTPNSSDKQIPNDFIKNTHFSVIVTPINILNNITQITELPNGLKINQIVSDSVFIHNCSFSPAGNFHFDINIDNSMNSFLCDIHCPEFGLNIICFYILINEICVDRHSETVLDLVNSFIKKLL